MDKLYLELNFKLGTKSLLFNQARFKVLLFAIGLLHSNFTYSNEPITLQLKWQHQFQFAGYYAAKEKGYYSDAGLDVTILERNRSLTPAEAVLTKKADYGVIGSSIILDRMNGLPLVALAAVMQHSPLVLVTMASQDILGPFELKGKRVMYNKGNDDATFIAMFHQLGISEKDFNHVPHSYDPESLIRGDIDAFSAYMTNQIFYFKEKGFDIQIINPINYGIDFYDDILFTSEETARNKTERTRKFIEASMKGWRYALANKPEIISWLKTKYPSKSSIQNLEFESVQIEKMILPDLVEIGQMSSIRFQRIADIYKERGLVSSDSSYEGIDFKGYLNKPKLFPFWIKVMIGVSIAFFILTITLLSFNRRLKAMVNIRAKELNIIQENLAHYINIVDSYVISSQTDLQGIIIDTSSAFCKVSGYNKDELIGKSHNIVRHPDTPDSVYKSLWATITKGDAWSGELKNLAKDGTTYWVEAKIDPIKDDKNEVCGYISIRQNITDKKHIEAISITDSLTGLNNRLRLDTILKEEFNRIKRYPYDLSIIICDIDLFKSVNDNFGHLVGDQLLIAIAKLLTQNCREVDVVGRWGGEEFLIICRETKASDAMLVAEKLRAIIEDNNFPGIGHKTGSFGVTSVLKNESVDVVLQRADTALYKAKNSGRNKVEIILP